MKNLLINIGKKSRKVFSIQLNSKKKDQVLKDYFQLIKKNKNLILKENAKDIKIAYKKKLKSNLIKRLFLDEKKITNIINTIKKIIKLKDPNNIVLEKWKRPNGLNISKVSIPIGVIAVIYESRPNVTSDVASLCFKSGNPVILKGGSEAFYSNLILSKLFRRSLKKNKIDENFVQFIDIKKRSVVDFMLTKMKKYIDVIIPRGGKSLVKKVQQKSSIPTIGHLEGICHVYIDRDADLKMAIKIVKNSKMRNVSICGAAETLLIDRMCLHTHCKPILLELEKSGCKIIGDQTINSFFPGKIKIATKKDWNTEYLNPTISVKCVNGVKDAIEHINKYGTSHTDSIITKNKKTAEKFLGNINSSIAICNASTQFADGAEFGFGAEVGISTGKLHPRGPVGLDQLTTYKYVLEGKGQIRN